MSAADHDRAAGCKMRVAGGRAWVSTDRAPINLFDKALLLDVHDVGQGIGLVLGGIVHHAVGRVNLRRALLPTW